VRGETGAEAVAIAQASVHLGSRLKSLPAERAVMRASSHGERPASSESIAKLPGGIRKILFSDDVFAYVPSPKIAPQDQLQFHFARFVDASVGVRTEKVVLAIVAHNFAQCLVCTDVLKFDIDNRIDPMLPK